MTSRFSPRSVWLTGLAAVALLAWGYEVTLESFVVVWNANRTYGYWALGLVALMVWRRRAEFGLSGASPRQLALVGACSVVWLVARIAGVQVIELAALAGTLVACGACIVGPTGEWRVFHLAPPLLLVLPIWEILLRPLQWMTVVANSVLIRLSGIQAVVDSTTIRFPFGSLEVAESCAGLSYLMTSVTMALSYAVIMEQTGRARQRTLGIGIVIAIIANWLRVFGLVWIGYRTHMQSSLMKAHGLYGWIIFSVAMVVFFLLAGRQDGPAVAGTGLPQGGRGANAAPPPLSSPAASSGVLRTVVLATALALIGPLLGIVTEFTTAPLRGPVAEIGVAQLDRFRPATATTANPAVSSARDLLALDTPEDVARERWTLADGSVQLDRLSRHFAARRNNDLSTDLNPVGRNPVLASRVVGPIDSDLRTVNSSVIRVGDTTVLIWSWYVIEGSKTPQELRAALLGVKAYLARHAGPALVAVSTVCDDATCAAAGRRLFEVTTGQPPVDPTRTP